MQQNWCLVFQISFSKYVRKKTCQYFVINSKTWILLYDFSGDGLGVKHHTVYVLLFLQSDATYKRIQVRLSFYLDHFNSKQVLTKVLVGPNNQFDPMERTFLNTCSIEGGGRILVRELFCGMNFSYPQWLCLLSGKELINAQIYQINKIIIHICWY